MAEEKFGELIEEMLDLAQVPPLKEQEDEEEKKEKPAEEPGAEAEPEKAEEEPAEEEPEEEEGELSDEWNIKIANFQLKMKWLNNFRRLGIKFRGPTKYIDVPKKLVVQEAYREPFLKFMREILDFMSTGNLK